MSFNRRIVVLICVLIAVIANCVFPYREYAQVKQTNVAVDTAILGTDQVSYSAAGWPWTYYHHFDCIGSPPWFVWNIVCLFGDILFWGIILAFAWWYGGTRRGITDGSKTKIHWRWSLIDLLVVMLLVAGLFGYAGRIRSGYIESERLIKSTRSLGGVASVCHHFPSWLPIDPILSLMFPWDRIAKVSLDDPPSWLLKEIVALPDLQSLRLSGSSYSLSDLQPLSNNPKLTELRLSGRELDSATIQLISRIKSLQVLNLMQSNVTASDLAALGDMPRLRYVHLGHTNVELKHSKLDAWMRTVRHLRLPRPANLDAPEFRLDGWPELVEIQCMEVDDIVDATPLKVSVSNAPKLKILTLLNSQRFDLSLSDLPRLHEIRNSVDLGAVESTSRIWVRSVDFNNLPSLAKVKFKFREFERIRTQNCPQLQCDASWGDSSERISESAAEQWIAGIGNSIGITSLNLTGLPFDRLDLSPIATCSSIKRLYLPISACSNSLLQSLTALNAMEELLMHGSNSLLSEFIVSELLRIWPNLKRIEGGIEHAIGGQDGRPPESLPRSNTVRLESAANLESYMKGDYRESPSVVLFDLPEFRDFVQVSRNLETIQIHGVPNLNGLVTLAPWPKDASIDGLNKLEIFAAGGPRFQDSDFSAIEGSTGLQSLTLGYCGMTAERLSAIGKFTRLQSLGLTGSAVTDETVQYWAAIHDLRNLMLDRTQITSASVPWICKLRSLEHLSIDSNCLTSVISQQLLSRSLLKSLSLFGDGLPWDALSEIVNWESLYTLKIENAKLTKEILLQLANSLPKSLHVLDLCNCRVEPNDLESFRLSLQGNIVLAADVLDQPVEKQLFPQYPSLLVFSVSHEDTGDFLLPNGDNYSERTRKWPTLHVFQSRPKGSRISADLIITSSLVVGPKALPFVKPSLFAPSPAPEVSPRVE